MEEKYPYQISQDPDLKKRFDGLHKDIMENVIEFCRDNGIEIDEFFIQADGMKESIRAGRWSPVTDSVCAMEIDRETANMEGKPFLLSM